MTAYQYREKTQSRTRRSRRRRRRRRRVAIVPFILLLLLIQIGIVYCWWQGSVYFNLPFLEYSEEELIEKGYPESLAVLYAQNEEARGFVLDYADYEGPAETIDISRELRKDEVPLFLQWDKRWGYETYGSDFLAVTGCGPTALAMVYCGLTDDASMNPLVLAERADSEGFYIKGSGSSWSMMTDLAQELGLHVRTVYFDRESILDELHQGHPIICIMGPGDFTTSGHFIVLVNASEDGMIEIRDPNSKRNSRKAWDIDVIMEQTINLWGYSYGS